MKHRMLLFLAVFALLLTGCGRAPGAVEEIARSAVAATPSLPAAIPTEPVQDTDAIITREEAEKIALDHAGFTSDQVEGLRTEFEIDDGVRQYDVQFYQERREYEYEIDAETGKILSRDIDLVSD